MDNIAVGKAAGRPVAFRRQLVIAFVIIAPGIESDHARNADEIERNGLEQIGRRHNRIVRIAFACQHKAFINQLLFTVSIVRANADAGEEAINILCGLNAQGLEVIANARAIHKAILAVGHRATTAVPALWVRDDKQIRVSIINGRLKRNHAATGWHCEAQAVRRTNAAATARAGVNFNIFFQLTQAGITGVQFKLQRIAGLIFHIAAQREDLGIAVHNVVAHHSFHAVKAAAGDQTILHRIARLQLCCAPLQGQLDAAQTLIVAEGRPIAIQGHVQLVIRLEFQNANDAIAIKLV